MTHRWNNNDEEKCVSTETKYKNQNTKKVLKIGKSEIKFVIPEVGFETE